MRIFSILVCLSSIWACSSSPNKATENPLTEEIRLRILWSVDWHPTKDLIVVGGMQDTLRLLSTRDFQILKNYPYKGTITKTKWHPTENKLAISVQDGLSYSAILNLDTDQLIELDTLTIEGARAIGWNHTGDLLAVGDYEGYLYIFDEEGSLLKRIHTKQKAIIGLDWHPKEDLIVAVGEKITLYHYEQDRLIHISDRNEEVEVLMLCVAWHPSGKFFVTGDYGDFQYHYPPLLQYWTYEGERILAIEESKAEYRNIKWSADGSLLATASEKIRLWNQEGQLLVAKATENLLWGIDWDKDDRQIVTTDEQGNIIFWDRNLHRLTELP